MEMQPARIGNRRQQGFLAAILAIAKDGTAHLGAMHAQLMGAAGPRP